MAVLWVERQCSLFANFSEILAVSIIRVMMEVARTQKTYVLIRLPESALIRKGDKLKDSKKSMNFNLSIIIEREKTMDLTSAQNNDVVFFEFRSN